MAAVRGRSCPSRPTVLVAACGDGVGLTAAENVAVAAEVSGPTDLGD